MTRGKKTCKILKEIRQQIADRNDIEYITSECHFQGECKGTCPKCEAELQYLENELSKRRQLGKAVAVAGISLGIASTFSACNAPQQQTDTPTSEQKIAAEMTNIDTTSLDTIPAIAPSKKGTLIEVPMMGKSRLVEDFDTIIHLEKINVIGQRPLFEMGYTGMIIETDTVMEEPVFRFEEVDILPIYLGGDKARLKFLAKKIKYPKEVKKNKIEGDVVIGFVVEKDGSLTDFSIVRSVHPLLDNEALRVVKLMPNWIPGKQRGVAVRVQYQVPISFTLD